MAVVTFESVILTVVTALFAIAAVSTALSANSDDPTAFAAISPGSTGTGNDENLGGYLRLFEPSSATFVKHFIAVVNHATSGPASNNCYMAGYCNTTSDVDAVQFKMSTGNIDAGDICHYGIK